MHQEFKAAADALNKQTLENNKAANKPDKTPTNYDQKMIGGR